MSSTNIFRRYQKWIGLVCIMIELNLFGGNILGFAALFDILPKYDIYSNLCSTSNGTNNNTTESDVVVDCTARTGRYQLALTLGIWFYNLLPFFIGPLLNYFGCRFLRLIGILFHISGWLCLGLMEPGKDYLLFIHTVFTSTSSVITLITCYVSCGYFSHHRALASSLMSGASISATMWYSIFQVLITNGHVTLKTLSYIWTGLCIIIVINSFLFMDWRYAFLNLPYNFDTSSETNNENEENEQIQNSSDMVWYQRITNRVGVWQHLLSPMYISVVLFLSFLLLPAIFLPVTWFPWVDYVTNKNEDLNNKYTFGFNLSTIAALIICPFSGMLLGFRADRSRAQKLFNISLMQTITWCLAVVLCVVRMFNTIDYVIAALVLNCLERSLIVGGSQAVIATFFPSKYIGTLTGVLWTSAALVSSIQYGLLPLVEDVSKSWQAWVIILVLIVVMSCHYIQLWYLYIQERRKPRKTSPRLSMEMHINNGYDRKYDHSDTLDSNTF